MENKTEYGIHIAVNWGLQQESALFPLLFDLDITTVLEEWKMLEPLYVDACMCTHTQVHMHNTFLGLKCIQSQFYSQMTRYFWQKKNRTYSIM
jgi:hypothetical protein